MPSRQATPQPAPAASRQIAPHAAPATGYLATTPAPQRGAYSPDRKPDAPARKNDVRDADQDARKGGRH